VASFREIARHVGDSWRLIDPPTRAFVEDVASLLKERHAELERTDGMLVMSRMDAQAFSHVAPSLASTVSSEAGGGDGFASSGPKVAEKRNKRRMSKAKKDAGETRQQNHRSRSANEKHQRSRQQAPSFVMVGAVPYSFNEGPVLAPCAWHAVASSDYYCRIVTPEAAPKSRPGLDRQVVAPDVVFDAGPSEKTMAYADVSDVAILNMYLSP